MLDVDDRNIEFLSTSILLFNNYPFWIGKVDNFTVLSTDMSVLDKRSDMLTIYRYKDRIL